MKILVTGANGFIGNYVVKELLKTDCQIIATGFNDKNIDNIEWIGKVNYFDCDLNSDIDFYNYFGKPEAVIHLAWAGLPNYKELFHLEKNLMSNYAFLSKLIRSGVNNVNVIGTCLEYGMINGKLEESVLSNPQVSYAIAKDTLRKLLEVLGNSCPIKLKWIRLFYLYGKGQSEKSILSQLNKAIEQKQEHFNMSGGEQLRDYLPVEKVAEIIVKTSLQDKVTGIINCCSGKPVSVRTLVENYLAKNNLSIKLNLGYYPYNDYEPFAFWGSTDKLNNILNQG